MHPPAAVQLPLSTCTQLDNYLETPLLHRDESCSNMRIRVPVDDLYLLHILLGCAHEQKALGVRLIANNYLKHNEANLSTILRCKMSSSSVLRNLGGIEST
jgi:hypothetical protein